MRMAAGKGLTTPALMVSGQARPSTQNVWVIRAEHPAFDPPAGSRNALERSPSLPAQLHEEQIRFILLVSLNAVFEGLAGGEVFNHKGKTDILIRMENTNVSSASA